MCISIAGVIYLQDGMIEHIQPESELDGAEPIPQEGEQVIDGRGCYAIPGMIDLHFHGCMGSDVCDATGGTAYDSKITRHRSVSRRRCHRRQ